MDDKANDRKVGRRKWTFGCDWDFRLRMWTVGIQVTVDDVERTLYIGLGPACVQFGWYHDYE